MSQKANKTREWVERNWEPVAIVVLAAILTGLLAFFGLYKSNMLSSLLLQFTGVLFGLLLTAYAILFGLIPIIDKDVLKARSFNKINLHFVFILRVTIVAIIISILIFLSNGIYQTILMYIQLGLSLMIIMWGFLLIKILSNLFVYIKNERIKNLS